MVFTEKIVEFLKGKPNYTADYHELRAVIGDETGAILKKLSKTADFSKFIQSNVVSINMTIIFLKIIINVYVHILI